MNVTQQKCACSDCVCIVEVKQAISKAERNYCSSACADGHPQESGCEHSGCACHG
jgi:hypothetical protein